jgi:hypothetical protein
VYDTSTPLIGAFTEIEIQDLFAVKKREGGFHRENLLYYLFIACG